MLQCISICISIYLPTFLRAKLDNIELLQYYTLYIISQWQQCWETVACPPTFYTCSFFHYILHFECFKTHFLIFDEIHIYLILCSTRFSNVFTELFHTFFNSMYNVQCLFVCLLFACLFVCLLICALVCLFVCFSFLLVGLILTSVRGLLWFTLVRGRVKMLKVTAIGLLLQQRVFYKSRINFSVSP